MSLVLGNRGITTLGWYSDIVSSLVCGAMSKGRSPFWIEDIFLYVPVFLHSLSLFHCDNNPLRSKNRTKAQIISKPTLLLMLDTHNI